MRRYLYIIGIVFCIYAKAQKPVPNFFSTTSSYFPYQTQSQCIFNFFNKYLVSNNLLNIDSIPCVNLELYDSNFNLLQNKTIKFTNGDGIIFYDFKPISINNTDSSIYVFATMAHQWNTNRLTNGVIWKLNKNLDTLWHKEYHNLNDSSLYLISAIKQNDGFLVYGASSLQDRGDPFILKIDFNGNELWRRAYHNASITSGFYKFIPTKSKGYAGIEHCVDHPAPGYSNIKVSYYDSLYNPVWSTIYLTPYRDLIGDLIETSDSNLVYTGGYCASQSLPPIGSLFTKQMIKKIDKNNGAVIWSKTYAYERYEVQLYGIYESPTKKLYSVGTAIRPNAEQPSGYVASLLVTDQYGDSLNYQETFHDTISNYTQLYNLRPINNGLICVGHTATAIYTGTVFTSYDHNNWLIKADTNGCFNQMCADGFNTSVEEMVFAKSLFKLYPNPANTTVVIQFGSEQAFSSAQIMIYDITGKLVIKQDISNKDSLHSININQLNTGMYLVTLAADGKVIEKQKLIKE